MTAELTFIPGRVPGISRSNIRATTGSRRHPAYAAGRVTAVQPDDVLLPGMTASQRRALAALIHTPAATHEPPDGIGRGATHAAWIAVVACALAWTMAIAVELAPDLGIARTALGPWLAQPHVGETRIL